LGERSVVLYASVPFCPSRCAYCSFVSADTARSGALIEPYLELLREEVTMLRRLDVTPAALDIGGGTPAVLSAEQLDNLLAAFELPAGTEITVEAGRPDVVTEEKLRAMKRRGVTRVCINPQSMNPTALAAIGRHHSPEDTVNACRAARLTGIETLNMDIIAGLPGDTLGGFCQTLRAVLEQRPENLTTHTLALKKGAALRGSPHPPERAALVGEMLALAYERLRREGYRPYYVYRQKFTPGGYENVGWTQPGRENLYNICMMEELTSVLAAGAGGVTKLVCPETEKITRLQNCKYPLEYLASRDKIADSRERIESFFAR
jgi:oxygen-independent coproporphyrinogen-3 oxidase